MAEAILNALQTKGVQHMSNIHVFDVNNERLDYLQKKFKDIKIWDSAQDCVQDADITIIAVKPQNVSFLASTLTSPPSGLVISIVAGLTISEISKKIQNKSNNQKYA